MFIVILNLEIRTWQIVYIYDILIKIEHKLWIRNDLLLTT